VSVPGGSVPFTKYSEAMDKKISILREKKLTKKISITTGRKKFYAINTGKRGKQKGF